MRYFIGSATHKLDAKGRVSLPSDYREVLRAQESADVFVVVPADPGGDCHLALSRTGHERLIERLATLSYATPAQRRETRRRYISEARPVSLEEGGRFVMARELRERLGLDKEVLFVGDGETFQIWAPARYGELHGGAGEAAALDLDFGGLV